MKPLSLLLLTGLLATACQKNEADVVPQEAEDPDWLKISVPTQYTDEAAQAAVGSLDNTLLVSAHGKIYATSDRGKSWNISRDAHLFVMGLLERNDTIFALGSSTYDRQGREIAISADAFTTDYGKTWGTIGQLAAPYKSFYIRQPIGRATTAEVTYQLEPIKQVLSPTSYLTVGHELLRTTAGGRSVKVRLPAARRTYINLHLDAQRRLYVTASAYRFDEAGNVISDQTAEHNAVVYVSRRPLP